MFSGVGLRATLERKFDEACVAISDRDNVIDRMAGHLWASRSDNIINQHIRESNAVLNYHVLRRAFWMRRSM